MAGKETRSRGWKEWEGDACGDVKIHPLGYPLENVVHSFFSCLVCCPDGGAEVRGSHRVGWEVTG